MRGLKRGFLAACAGGAALLAPAQAGAAETVEHQVRTGDNLHLVAGYYYRDPRQWKRVWRLNRQSVPRPGLLRPGTSLRVETEPGVSWEIPYEEFRARAARK